MRLRRWFRASILLAGVWPSAVLAQGTPVPCPFPGSSCGPASTTPPAPVTPSSAAPAPAVPVPANRPAPPAAQSGAPTDATLGVAGIIAPGLEFLESFDAGGAKGQRCYLFGTNAGFAETLAYYKQLFKDGGRELFKSPAMQQFDLAKFQEQTMVYQPSVVVKDYGGGSAGYLHVVGTKEQRYLTIVQIVPSPAR